MIYREIFSFITLFAVTFYSVNAISCSSHSRIELPPTKSVSGPREEIKDVNWNLKESIIEKAEEAKKISIVDDKEDIPSPPYIIKVKVVIEANAEGELCRSTDDILKDFDVAVQLFGEIDMSFIILSQETISIEDETPSERDYRLDAMMSPGIMSVYYIFGHKWLTPHGLSSFPWDKDRTGMLINGSHADHFTLAHEIGHYFGLWHTFDEGSKKGDFVKDTTDECDWVSEEPYSTYNNIMNYTSADTKHITMGQLERVRYYLNTFRKDHLFLRSGDFGSIMIEAKSEDEPKSIFSLD